jgi:7-cyano-7-deazaguanine synthase
VKPDSVFLLSGGLDSTTALYWAIDRGFHPTCLTFAYGQRHAKEVKCAQAIAKILNLPHQVCVVPMPWKASALTDRQMKLPEKRTLKQISRGIPNTYVPARNTIFLSLAVALAESLSVKDIFIGAHQLDYSGYPDCRPRYFRAMERAFNLGTKQGVTQGGFQIHAPLLHKNKSQIIRLARRLKVPFRLTWSCYAGTPRPCGVCDSCLLRRKGFSEVGIKDS